MSGLDQVGEGDEELQGLYTAIRLYLQADQLPIPLSLVKQIRNDVKSKDYAELLHMNPASLATDLGRGVIKAELFDVVTTQVRRLIDQPKITRTEIELLSKVLVSKLGAETTNAIWVRLTHRLLRERHRPSSGEMRSGT